MSTSPLPPSPLTLSPVGQLRTEAGIRHAWLAHGAALRGYARRTLGDRGLAEDALQEVFLRAWRAGDGYDPARGGMRAWLFAIMRNVLIDMARARARRVSTTPITSEVSAVPEEIDALVDSLALGSALRSLSEEHREVILHGCIRQRPHREIAQLLGVPIGTVRSRLFYARSALSSALRSVAAA